MPEKLEKCVADVKAKGTPDSSAWPICIDSTGEKPHKEYVDILETSDSTLPFFKKKTQEKDYPWGQCMSDNEGKYGKDGAQKVCGSIKAKNEISEAIIKEHVGDNPFLIKGKPDKARPNANRQVPLFNPPITNRPVEPKIDKTTKGIGGQVGKIDSKANTNNMTTDLWKKILDEQLKRNVREPRY